MSEFKKPPVLDIFDDVLLGKILPLFFFGFFTIAMVHNFLKIYNEAGPTLELTESAQLTHFGLNIIFWSMMTWMYLMRTKPTGRTEFRSQKIIAFVGSFAMFFSPIQQENMSSDPVIITTALSIMVIGGIFTIYALANLRRNFSIIPEARSVVTTGPYRFIRHPMYTSEIVWSFGMILPALTWQVGAAYALMLTCLILRAGFEEAVLEKHFPEYGEFRKKTWRFIPLVY